TFIPLAARQPATFATRLVFSTHPLPLITATTRLSASRSGVWGSVMRPSICSMSLEGRVPLHLVTPGGTLAVTSPSVGVLTTGLSASIATRVGASLAVSCWLFVAPYARYRQVVVHRCAFSMSPCSLLLAASARFSSSPGFPADCPTASFWCPVGPLWAVCLHT